MEHEIVNKETPEMKQLISGIQEVSKRIREIAQTHRPLFGGEIYLTGRQVCECLFCRFAIMRKGVTEWSPKRYRATSQSLVILFSINQVHLYRWLKKISFVSEILRFLERKHRT